MIITEKQLLVLFDLAVWFSQLNMVWREFGPPFTKENICELVNEIYNQQSNILIDVKTCNTSDKNKECNHEWDYSKILCSLPPQVQCKKCFCFSGQLKENE